MYENMFYEVLHLVAEVAHKCFWTSNVRQSVNLSNHASSLAIFQPIKTRVNSHGAFQSHKCAWTIATQKVLATQILAQCIVQCTIATLCYSHTNTWTMATQYMDNSHTMF